MQSVFSHRRGHIPKLSGKIVRRDSALKTLCSMHLFDSALGQWQNHLPKDLRQ